MNDPADPDGDAVLVDARGMRCPWPALRLARAVRAQPERGRYRLLADDPNAAAEIAALARTHGWRVAANGEAFDLWT